MFGNDEARWVSLRIMQSPLELDMFQNTIVFAVNAKLLEEWFGGPLRPGEPQPGEKK